MSYINIQEPILCYVEGCWAYFTTQPLSKQNGDDWNDAPYEHNAGAPYEPCWHNDPKHLSDTGRGMIEPGELCRNKCCINDWTEDGSPMWQILKVAWEGPYVTPDEGCSNSRYSVDDINAGSVAWFRRESYSRDGKIEPILAGTTLSRFVELMEQAGGTVYFPKETP